MDERDIQPRENRSGGMEIDTAKEEDGDTGEDIHRKRNTTRREECSEKR